MKQYIAAVVTEIKRRIKAHKETLKNYSSGISEMILKGSMNTYQSLLHFLDTLETKEVDLEKEIFNYLDNHNLSIQDGGRIVFNNGDTPNLFCDFRDIAKHFYELGLKAKGK